MNRGVETAIAGKVADKFRASRGDVQRDGMSAYSLRIAETLHRQVRRAYSGKVAPEVPVDPSTEELQRACDRAAREFLALTAWSERRAQIEEAVIAVTTGANISNTAMGWLLSQIADHSCAQEPLAHAARAQQRVSLAFALQKT